MSSASPDAISNPEDYRGYLRFLVGTLVDPRFQAKIDLSGIVQQTLLDVHQACVNRVSPVTYVSLALLRKILASNLNDEFRKLTSSKRNLGSEVSLEQALDASSCRLNAIIAARDPTPVRQAARDEATLAVVALLDQLPESQRQAIVMQFWQDRSISEIAETMGRTRFAVAGLLKRGLQRLRSLAPGLLDPN